MKLLLFLFGVSSAFSMDIVVPAYFHPGTHVAEWNRMLAVASNGTKLTVIMDPPANKSGSYETAANNTKASGATLVSYVTSSHAKRPLNDVKAEIANHNKWYKPNGFFIDEMGNENNATMLAYYKSLYLYIKGLGNLTVIANPGVVVKDLYLTTTVADRFMNFEGNHTKYQTISLNQQTSTSFIHCVYDATTESDMKKDLNFAKTRNAQGIYITNLLTDKYGALPSYWSKLVAEVNKINVSG